MKRIACVVLISLCALLQQAAAQPLPSLFSSRLPMYPEKARLARITGTVKLWFTVGSDGKVTHAEIISGHPILATAALECVRSWEFRVDGPLSNKYETEFVYGIGEQEKSGNPKLTVTLIDAARVEVNSEYYEKPIY